MPLTGLRCHVAVSVQYSRMCHFVATFSGFCNFLQKPAIAQNFKMADLDTQNSKLQKMCYAYLRVFFLNFYQERVFLACTLNYPQYSKPLSKVL